MKKYDLEIIIGWECNNNCMFCSNPEMKKIFDSKNTEKMDVSMIKIKLSKYNPKEIKTLIFVGGEPTISKNLFELINFSIHLGFQKIFLMTNGRMLSNKSFFKKLLKYPQIELGISIHGHNSEIHDSLTRTEGSFKQTIKGMNNLKKIGKKFTTNTVINKKNYRFLSEIVKLISTYNPELMLFSFPWPKGNAKDNFDKIIPTFNEIKNKLIETLKLGEKLKQNIKVMDIPFCILGNYHKFMHELDIERHRKIITHAFEPITYGKNFGKEKIKCKSCKSCKFFKECEGVWETYIEIFGFNEFKPINI